MRILLVDDKIESLRFLRPILEASGFEVESAANGSEALAVLRDRGAELIVSDILMPVMDGYQLCRQVKQAEELRDIPFVFLTASYTDPQDEDLALRMGADMFLRKPVEPARLVEILKTLVENRPFEGARSPAPPKGDDGEDVFRLYNEKLIKKLEEKMLALERSREEVEQALEESRKKQNEINGLLGGARAVLEYPRFEDAARAIFTICRNLIGAACGCVALMGPEGTGSQVLLIETGGASCSVDASLPVHVGALGADTCRNGKTVYDNRFSEGPSAGRIPQGHVRLENVLFSPMIIDDRVAGLIGLANKPGGFDDMDVRMAEAFSRLAAVALRNSRTSESLQKSEARYRLLVENAPLGILAVDRQGEVTECNPKIHELLGMAPKEHVPCGNLFSLPSLAGSGIIEDFLKCLESGAPGTFERPYLSPEGRQQHLRYHLTPIPVADAGYSGVLAVVEEISETRRLMSQLQQAQKMEAIGTLAGGIAHDFNNILSAILGYMELAGMSLPPKVEGSAYLEEAMKAAKRARDLVFQILTFSRQSPKSRVPIQLHPILKEALKLLRSSLPATIEIRQQITGIGTVDADPTQIHQVVMNLCTNAYHAMREKGGILSVDLSEVVLDEESAHGYLGLSPGPYLRLSVSDTGYGMSPEIMARMYDPYFTTKEKEEGTGLGLSMVHGIVKEHRGAITCYSEPGRGTTFHVYLPENERRAKESQPKVQEPIATGSGYILLVDDEPALVRLGKQMLERIGYRVETRTNGIEALELFQAAPDAFDLVLTDMTMPHMTGDQLAAELLAIRPGLPVILCTGFSERVTLEKARALGIRDLLMKPLLMRDLAEKVRKALGPIAD